MPMIRLISILISCLAALAFGATARATPFMPDGPGQKVASVPNKEVTANHRSHHRPFVDKVVVKKSERRLYLMKNGKPFRTYKVSLGFRPEGHKEYQGDGRTPEGRYFIDWRNSGSRFWKALHISYPSYSDRTKAMRRGVDPGGMIMIHGQPRPSQYAELQEAARKEDWTHGCVAVSNLAVDEIWEYTLDGTPVEILP